MRNRYRIYILIGVTAAAGCASGRQKVEPIGQDAFRVSASSPIFASQASANYKALDAARSFCDKTGEQVLFRQSQESGLHSWSPKQEDLTFICASASLRGIAVAKD